MTRNARQGWGDWAQGLVLGCSLLVLTACVDFDFSVPTMDAGGDGQSDGGPKEKGSCEEVTGLLACSTFEPPMALGPFSVEERGDAELELTTQRSYSGTQAVEATLETGGDFAWLEVSVGNLSKGSVWFRAMVLLEDELESATFVTMASLESEQEGYVDLGMGRNFLSMYSGQADESWMSTPLALHGSWTCLEWEIQFGDGAAGDKMALWRDGMLLKEAPSAETTPSPAYHRARIGVSAEDPLAVTFYFDDVAVATDRIGCP
ncbi:MAG: hypothetical protein KC416_04155 [Myxococcales bacterium]|nr:hypothetical protein [Myxococcales bacterium]